MEVHKGKVLAIANQKGGVAKTTTTVSLLAALSMCNRRVLGIDMDPQGNLSANCDAKMYDVPTTYELLKGEVSAQDAIQHISTDSVTYDIIPANVLLAGAEQEIVQTGKEYRLREALAPIRMDYDYIINDTPPALSILTIDAFTAADDIIIPTTPSTYALSGIRQLYDTIETVKKYCNPSLRILGILITRYKSRQRVSKQLTEFTLKLGEMIQAPVFATPIRDTVAIEESQATATNILQYNKKSVAAIDYMNFALELLSMEEE